MALSLVHEEAGRCALNTRNAIGARSSHKCQNGIGLPIHFNKVQKLLGTHATGDVVAKKCQNHEVHSTSKNDSNLVGQIALGQRTPLQSILQ